MCFKRAARPSKACCEECAAYFSKKHQERAKAYREAVFGHYGTSCKCCGESEPQFLTIDHIDGGGKKDREVHGIGIFFYKWLMENGFPPGLQTLCMNCNFAKGVWGKCPHQKDKENGQ